MSIHHMVGAFSTASFAGCDGARWHDYGEEYVFTERVDPRLGYDSVAGSLRFGDGVRGDARWAMKRGQ